MIVSSASELRQLSEVLLAVCYLFTDCSAENARDPGGLGQSNHTETAG